MKIKPPPPVIDKMPVLRYALIGKDVEPQDHHSFRVARCLVICRNNKRWGDTDDYLLYLCDAQWDLHGGLHGGSIEYLQQWAESKFKGISKQWINPNYNYTKKQVKKYLLDMENQWDAYVKDIIAAVKQRLKNKKVKCCVCKKLTDGTAFVIAMPSSVVKYAEVISVPVSVASNLRNVNCFHAACKNVYMKSFNDDMIRVEV